MHVTLLVPIDFIDPIKILLHPLVFQFSAKAYEHVSKSLLHQRDVEDTPQFT